MAKLPTDSDYVYKYDREEQRKLRDAAPWANDPEYFKKVKISSVAFLKMILHARKTCTEESFKASEPIEVMGLLNGKIEEHTFVITDSFGVCEGNEVSVQPKDSDYEYMSVYSESSEKVGKMEPVIGWYHSHPGLGVFLSGVDVSTQRQQQFGQDPYLAMVVDPLATVSSGKPKIGAFRVFPDGYKPKNPVNWTAAQTIYGIDHPGTYKDQFYPLEVTIYKSGLDGLLFDQLYQQFWGKQLSSSKNLVTRDFVTAKITVATQTLDKIANETSVATAYMPGKKKKKEEDSEFDEVCKEVSKVSVDQLNGSFTQLVKESLFKQQ
eukprot:TRINITY_DN86_c0_g1_i1.p1 TRINITY_DN86_c0_g1~~TRINITY_DN86_c0_g1_i1.p1  ORF type:complete len:322 (-),score=81.76 TRINITY_DN86_c0_g1_i1:264-1229(-)